MFMAGSGPTPNPASRRQSGNQAHTWVDLPASGYAGAIPEWPMFLAESGALERIHDRELEVWQQVWRTPQAEVWARNGWTHDVALYVRYFVLGDFGNLDAAKEARMWSDRLGLNPAAMLKNRWRVRTDEVGEQRAKTQESAAGKARRRLKVADGAVAGS